jgi:hypothetical protein
MSKIAILLNGQLRYYKDTINYWKKFKKINNAEIYIITEKEIQYKNGDKEIVDDKLLQELTNNIYFIDGRPKNRILNKIDKLWDNIQVHNKIYNSDHDLSRYSKKNYAFRSLFRQVETLYLMNKFLKEKDKKYDKYLYARVDFLLYKREREDYIKDGEYDIKWIKKNYIDNNRFTIPNITKQPNFSISDFTFYGDYKSLYEYLDTYVNNWYKLTWDNCKIHPSVEAQAAQIRRLLNKNNYDDRHFTDIVDYENNLLAYNYFYDTKKRKPVIRIHRSKKENWKKSNSPNKTISNINKLSLVRKEIRNNMKNKILWFSVSNFLIEIRNMNRTTKKELEEMGKLHKKIKEAHNSNIVIIDNIDLHRVHYPNFMKNTDYFKIKYMLMMYCPWFIRNIFKNKKEFKNSQLVFYPRYLWAQSKITRQLSFNPFEIEKKYDILLYGCLKPKVRAHESLDKNIVKEISKYGEIIYPLRRRVDKLLRTKQFSNYNIKFVEWKSKRSPDGIYGEDLRKLIAQSKFTFATCASVQYLVRKYYEIPFNGSIMIGNVPDYAPKIIKDNIIEIYMDMSDEQIIKIIKNSIDNYENYKYMIENGKKFLDYSKIITESQYVEDMINYKETGLKTRQLREFMDKLGIIEVNSLTTKPTRF